MRSHEGFGVGEFNDVKRYSDWAKSVGIKLIQILPVNDTTTEKNWKDSYPYEAISIYAFHPMYIHLPAVAGKAHANLLKKYEEKRLELNALPEVDYEQVNEYKWQILRELYPLLKEQTFNSDSYKEFYNGNKHWLLPYAVYCLLRDKHSTPDFNLWGTYAIYDETFIQQCFQENEDAVNLHNFIQYHLHLQLKDAVAYAHKNKVVLKGDIAIGVSRNSVDAWQYPELFNMDMQAGAPPDDFAITGQNWSFPTYNWDAMRAQNFEWWRERLHKMSEYFDVIRIDHILGFFRIWSIPYEAVQGILGHFEPAIPVYLNELYGINVSTERLMNPYINDYVLHELFGSEADFIKQNFLEKEEDGSLVLKKEYATQRQIKKLFEKFEDTAHNRWLKERLYDLIANVVLIQTNDFDTFHLRFNMQHTLSYQVLDDGTKSILNRLYYDYFFHRQDHLWKEEAYQKLPAIKEASDMLICGEDLGLVPGCVKEVMQNLQFLSLEIQRMPKNQHLEFENPLYAPFLSVVSPSTHDTSTIRGWWNSLDWDAKQRFAHTQFHTDAIAPDECHGWVVEAIINQHLHSWAMWSIFLLQDLFAMDEQIRQADAEAERINHPENPEHYWRYRSHIAVEDLLNASAFNKKLATMIQHANR